MIVAITFFSLLWIFQLFNGLRYLLRFVELKRSGIKTIGKVVSFVEMNNVINKFKLIPVIEFTSSNEVRITGKPFHSYLIGRYDPGVKREVTVYYDKENPHRFIVENRYEVLMNVAVLIASIMLLIWCLVFKIDELQKLFL
jgi:hypothetical protein